MAVAPARRCPGRADHRRGAAARSPRPSSNAPCASFGAEAGDAGGARRRRPARCWPWRPCRASIRNQFAAATAEQWRNRADHRLSTSPARRSRPSSPPPRSSAGVVASGRPRSTARTATSAVGKRVIHDSHPYGVLSFADVIAQSSNIGAAKVAERLGRRALRRRAASSFGFGRADRHRPARRGARPAASDATSWGRINLVTTAFGQGIAVTPLQLTRAFAAIANGGHLMRPYVVRRITRARRPRPLRRPARTSSGSVHLAQDRRRGHRAPASASSRPAPASRRASTASPSPARPARRRRSTPHTGRYQRARPHVVLRRLRAGRGPGAGDPGRDRHAARRPPTAAWSPRPSFARIAEYGLARRGAAWRSRSPALGRAAPRSRRARSSAVDRDATSLPPRPAGCRASSASTCARRWCAPTPSGWEVRVDGSGYVVPQDPPPGAVPPTAARHPAVWLARCRDAMTWRDGALSETGRRWSGLGKRS